MADPQPVTTSPFEAQVTSPFGDTAAVTEPQNNDNVATPSRTATMALAMLHQQQEKTRDDISQTLQDSLAISKNIIESGQEGVTRLQAVVESTKDQIAGLHAQTGTEVPGTGQLFTPELVHNVQQTTAADRANRMDDLSHSALEEQAVHNISDLIAGGNYVEARAALNRMDPSKNSTFGVIRDYYKKDLIVANAVEKAGFEANEESLWHKVLTTVISLPESFMFSGMRSQLGNVDKGVGGYKPSFWRFVDPTGELESQVVSWQSLDADQQAKYLPNLLSHIQSNSTRLGASDPGKSLELLNAFKGDVDSYQRFMGDASNALDIALIAPLFKGVGAGLTHGTQVLTGMGARSAASNRVANAFETAAKEGLASMTQKTAVVPDELIEQGLPGPINPLIVPRKPSVKASLRAGAANINTDFNTVPKPISMAGDVAEKVAYADEVMNGGWFDKINAPNRFFNDEEKQVAIKSALTTIEGRTRSNVLDYTPETVRLANGQEVTQLDVTMNKPFASAEEARNWLHNQGYGADITNAVEKQITTERKVPKASANPHGAPQSYVASERENQLEETIVSLDDVIAKGGKAGERAAKMQDQLMAESGKLREERQLHTNDTTPETPLEAAQRKAIQAEDEYNKHVGFGEDIPDDHPAYAKSNTKVYKAWKAKADELEAKKNAAGAEHQKLLEGNYDIIQDTSGQFFPKVKVFMRETGFYTGDLNPPNQHFASRWFGSAVTTSDPNLFAKGTTAGQVQQQWMKEIKGLNKTVTKLGPNDRTYLREVIQRGINEERWLSPTEFDTIWSKATGKLPNDNVKAAYWNFQTANDVDYIMRNANSRAELAIRGVEKVRFNALGKDVDALGIVEHDLKDPEESFLDTSTGITHKAGEPGPKRLEELQGEGYFLVTTEDGVKLKDGSTIRKFLVKKGELESNQLPEYVLPYSEGGHRVYTDKYFVKQAVRSSNVDGTSFLEKPKVYVTAGTKAEANKWASIMEDARLAVRDKADAAFLDANVFKGIRGLPTGDEFLKGLKSGVWSLDHPFEALFDRELPSEYAKTGGRFAEESGANGFYRTHGQLYYSAKGDEALKNVAGELSPTLDPFKMQNQALFNVARLSSFDDFKTSAVHRWVNTYGQFLEYNPEASPAEIFNGATVGRRASLDLKHQIEGQREAIQRMLNFRSDFDLWKEATLRKTHEWISGRSDAALFQAVSKAPLWLIDHNPINVLRGLAFDMKLGMLNPGQLLVQISTAFSAIAMSPKAGLKGMFTIAPWIAYRTAIRNGVGDNVLDVLAKRGFAKLSGFSTEAEFKNYFKFLDKSGFFAFGDSHLLINTSHPAAAYSFLNKQDAIRTAGRFFFNRAEDANRLVAARIAYDEAVTKFGKADFGNFEFGEFFRARAENYSFNMSQSSAAAWQKGILSIPTQFWAYNWRMMEGLVGKQFTRNQKIRLLMAQLFMAGAAGVPLGSLVTDLMNKHTGAAPRLAAHPDDARGQPSAGEVAYATLQRGMVDELVNQMTGADVQIGQRLGTGDFFQQLAEKFAGYSEYSDKVTPAELAGGATYAIMGDALDAAFNTVRHLTAAETGGLDAADMTSNDWETMAKQISSVNNIFFKRYYAEKFGIYQSQKGKTLISDLPKGDTFFLALGMAPGELRDRSAIMAWKDHRKEMIKDSADIINNLYSESIREPDKFDQNSRIISQIVAMLPPEQRGDVLRQAHISRDPSDYSKLLRIKQSTQVQDEAIRDIDAQFNKQQTPTNEEVAQ